MKKYLAQGIQFILQPILNVLGLRLSYSLQFINRSRVIENHYLDYIRLSSLELAAHTIRQKNIPGDVAELGVYKGKFARYINQYFPDRSLYLFDTFEGFAKEDIEAEKKSNYSTGEQDFSDTSVDAVLKRMPHPQQCIVRKGFFPKTAEGLETTFCFVSLDADLFDPIYAGLVYFYPRLSSGGYIFIHDFSNAQYKGASEAVMRFCKENGIGYTLLPDSCGSAIIAKG